MDEVGFIEFNDKYSGEYLIFPEDTYQNEWGAFYIKVQCPHCKEFRYVRRTLLSDTNKNKQTSTLCTHCSKKTENLFYKDDDCVYTIVNGHKVLIDEDDIERCRYLRLQETKGHVSIRIDKSHAIPFHRFICGVENDKNVPCVDHKNHNGLDNRKENLRPATYKENFENSMQSTNKTGFKNISLCPRPQKWFVQYKTDDKKRKTKRFYNFIDAYRFLKENKEFTEYSYDILNDSKNIIRYSGIYNVDLANGEGVGSVLFVQNCTHHCYGCHNPETWDCNGGNIFTRDIFNDLLEQLSKPYITRLTLSGGDPFDNLRLSNYVAAEFKYMYPDKKLWIYTGYTLDELKTDIKYLPLLDMADVLVDGRYKEDERDLTLKWKGSSNQTIWRNINGQWIADTK